MVVSLVTISSNRTFMELKFGSFIQSKMHLISSNRTFMELKWANHEQKMDEQLVLIVPLWN